ncbi:MAG: Trp family transcriptional regulator [Patescibacteria group bacterium]
MTKLSRWKVEPEKMNLFLDDFWSAVASLESKEEARMFFNQFLTHTERKMFAKRFQIVMMLLLGYDYATIKNRVRVTDPTIAKMNNWIEENREALIKVAQRILSLKKKKGEETEGRGNGGHMRGDLLSSVVSEVSNMVIRSAARRKKRSSLAK